jgi:hypothetical protein
MNHQLFFFKHTIKLGYSLEPNICSYKHFLHVISCNGNQKFSKQTSSPVRQRQDIELVCCCRAHLDKFTNHL